MAELPEGTNLRLDANGGLTLTQAQRWLEICDRTTCINVEYLEQPLPVDQVDAMHQLSREYQTPLALDESVATLRQLKQYHEQGWQGVMVVKPAIAGYPQNLRAFLQSHSVDAVFSSVFETEIGRNAALKLARDCRNRRAVGFGIEQWFTTAVEYDLEPTHLLNPPQMFLPNASIRDCCDHNRPTGSIALNIISIVYRLLLKQVSFLESYWFNTTRLNF